MSVPEKKQDVTNVILPLESLTVKQSTSEPETKFLTTGSHPDEPTYTSIWARQKKEIEKHNMETESANSSRPHLFWDTQPVTRAGEAVPHEGPMRTVDPAALRADPYPLANTLHWCTLDVVHNPTHLSELHELLLHHYVEDDDAMFRFQYPTAFLRWALTPPRYDPSWHIGVRRVFDGTLLASITAVPCTVRLGDRIHTVVEINFLCIHHKLREKRLAPILIKEITRRVNHRGIFYAVFTSGTPLTVPVAKCRYWHRPLHPEKLLEVGFSKIPEAFMKRFKNPLGMTRRHYALPAQGTVSYLRVMRPGDVSAVQRVLQNDLKKVRSHATLLRRGGRALAASCG